MSNILQGKIHIKGELKTITGLHIGGSKSILEVGGIDNAIIKTTKGKPYIPGSSLKGKLRNMLARAVGSKCVKTDIDLQENSSGIRFIANIFGIPEGEDIKSEQTEALLKVRDCFPVENCMLEIKTENSINRLTGEANPRPLERVAEGNFSLEMTLDVFDPEETKIYLKEIQLAMLLLEQDHLGGSGSRGCGKIKFSIQKLYYLKISDFKLAIDDSFEEDFDDFKTTINTSNTLWNQ